MEDDESYSSAMSRILQNARGPLEDIEEFETSEPAEPEPNTPTPPLIDPTDDRLAILRMAAIMAVLSMSDHAPATTLQVGRRLGTSWAQDHRLSAMGLPGLAHSTQQRASWR
jgi:hypothetical protein